MRLNTNPGPNSSETNELHANPGLRVRELSEAEIIERILQRTGPGSLMDDLAKYPMESSKLSRIRLR